MEEVSCNSQMSRQKMAQEDATQEKVDDNGIKWRKVYFGSGEHFRNWLAQAEELGEVQVEEVSPEGLECFEKSGEKLYRIWVKK